MNPELAYKQALADFIGGRSEQFYLYWKGRVALYAALKAIGIREGDEVILPSFTCVVVPNAIIYLKAKPIYVDIDQNSLNTTLELIKNAVTDRTKCILIQNTFGLSSEVDEIIEFAKSKSIFTIEDCTHGFGGNYRGRPNGTRSDLSFFSSQWNKPFSTGVGGILLVNDTTLIDKVQNVNKGLIKPSLKAQVMLKLLILFNKFFITDRTYWYLVKVYRFLSKTGLVIGSSSGGEISSTVMPDKFFMAGCDVQFKEGVKAVRGLKLMMIRRIKNAQEYGKFLKLHGKYYVKETYIDDHSFLKYPFLVKDREAFMVKAEKASVRLGEWFESPIHPVKQEFEKWGLQPSDFPISEYMSKHILNLPTEIKDTRKVIELLENNCDDLL